MAAETSLQSSVTSVSSLNSVTTPAQQASSSLGKPSSVANGTLSFGATTFTGTLLYTGHDWVEPALARRSMELMAREVIPRVNKALALP